jgi:hypothetical protein
MDKYSIKLEVLAEVEAFSEADAREYISDIFNIDDEIKNVKVIKVTKNS